MKETKFSYRITAALALGLLLLPLSAYSYIDLGSGSYIIQLIIAGFVGFSLSVRIFWKKIKSRFSKKEKTRNTLNAQ